MKRYSPLPFFIVMFAMTVLAFLLPLRPSYSEYEKRQLAAFPKFTFESLVSGDFFDDVSLWFSDTFPLRESISTASDRIEMWHGVKNTSISGDITHGDDIPTAPPTTTRSRPSGDTTSTTKKPPSSSTTKPTTGTTQRTTPTEGHGRDVREVDTQNMGAILVVGDSGYEYYAYVQSYATRYIEAVNKAGELLAGKSRVIDMVIPTSIGVVLPEDFRQTINSSDQMAAIEYFCSQMGENVLPVNVLHTLRAHNEEYIYFRTDHHWTALGAYYAYEEMLYAMDMIPEALSGYETVDYDNYLGSFYFQADKPACMAETPDIVTAYYPHCNNEFTYTTAEGKTVTGAKLIADATNYKNSYKYLCFIAGDQPYEEIVNTELPDGPTCVVVKESFGNALIPFLVDHYSKIYVVDYRYYTGTLSEVCAKDDIDDVFFLNNISMTRSSTLIGYLENFVQ